METNLKEEPRLTLRPARLEPFSAKVQMLVAAFAILLVTFVTAAPALNVGFLLDDYLHLDYIYRAATLHDWHDFLHNFVGNWANSPLMQSYRPLVSVSLFLDYLFWGANAWGFHLCNLILMFLCSLGVGLITLEFTGMRGNRMGAAPAFWAGLLFAVYPAHLEASAWIIGRVDLLCTMFFLSSVYCYLRFRLLRESGYLWVSVISFVAALLSKEMAVVLPVVITAIELVLYPYFREHPDAANKARRQNIRLQCVFIFWLVLGLYFTLRLALLNTLVGGYGTSSVPLAVILSRLTDKASWDQLLFPVNLDILSRTADWSLKEQLVKLSRGLYITILSIAGLRALSGTMSLRILGVLVIWLLVGITPTYQIWNVSPNMVGSRLFFLSSAPFVILLCLFALPCIDAIKARYAKILACVGTLALLGLSTLWSYWMQVDLSSWRGAASELKSFQNQIDARIRSLPAGKKLVLANLPSDYSGAGVLTRNQYLKFIESAPISKTDRRNSVDVLVPDDAVSNFDYATAIENTLRDPAVDSLLIWNSPVGNSTEGKLDAWNSPKASGTHSEFAFGLMESLPTLVHDYDSASGLFKLDKSFGLYKSKDDQWSLSSDGNSYRLDGTGFRVRPIKSGITVFLKVPALSPLSCRSIVLKARLSGKNSIPLDFLWSSERLDSTDKQLSCKSLTLPISRDSDSANVELFHCKPWCLSNEVQLIGLHIPQGDYELTVSSIGINAK